MLRPRTAIAAITATRRVTSSPRSHASCADRVDAKVRGVRVIRSISRAAGGGFGGGRRGRGEICSTRHPLARAEGDSDLVNLLVDEETSASKTLTNSKAWTSTPDVFEASFGELKRNVLAHAQQEEREEHPPSGSTTVGSGRRGWVSLTWVQPWHVYRPRHCRTDSDHRSDHLVRAARVDVRGKQLSGLALMFQ